MVPSIVPLYAALLAALYLVLSVAVIRQRRRRRIALGSGGLPEVERAIRAHGNFAEYVPFALLLLAFAELRGNPGWLLHLLCLMLLAGRLAHGWGLSQVQEDYRWRSVGMALTFTVLAAAALVLLWGVAF